MNIIATLYQWIIALGNFLKPFFLLAVRLFWGWQFFSGGLGKFSNLPAIAEYFASLNLPLPMVSAFMASSAETIGGALLLVGFASRLAAIPLIFTMVVAMFTAHREQLQQVWDNPSILLDTTPFTFLMASLIVFIFGPGAFSIDAIIKRFRVGAESH